MAKYSQGFKLKIVQEYLKGNLGYLLLAQKYGIPSPTPIKRWVRAYKAFGEKGLHLKTKHEVRSRGSGRSLVKTILLTSDHFSSLKH